MPKKLRNCTAGHKMTVENTYHHKQHGHTYDECRECIKVSRKNGSRHSVADQRRIAKIDIIAEDITGITNCPKCEGILRWGEDSRLEDAVSCIYCGWRPSAMLAVQP